MAGIEKVCEAVKDGHWHNKETFLPWDKDGKSIYRNTIQVCLEHRKELKEKFNGKYHEIVLTKGRYPNEFELKVKGVPCPFYENGVWERWFLDERVWKNNMKQLLGVKRLRIVDRFSF